VLFLALTLGNRGQVKRRVHARTHACTHAQQDHTQEGSTGRGGGGQAGANLIGWPLPISRLGQSQSEGLHIHIVFREPSFSLGLPTIAALRAKRLARVGQARKKFGSHYVLYYVLHSAVLKIATRRLPPGARRRAPRPAPKARRQKREKRGGAKKQNLPAIYMQPVLKYLYVTSCS
jgi:hypothetical protein